MAATLIPPGPPPKPEEELVPSGSGNGPGGGDAGEATYDPEGDEESESRRWATPPSAYRAGVLVGMCSTTSLFAALTKILQVRWIHSKDWVSIPLPHLLYANTAIILISSLTIELARASCRSHAGKRYAAWLYTTLLLGIVFLAGQIAAWQDLTARGVYLASNPGSLFFFLITGAHGIHLLAGIIAVACVALGTNRLKNAGIQQTAADVIALYWHFLDGLWIYLLVLLLISVQR